MALSKLERRLRIKRRIRKIISGSNEVPRMSVFRSNKQISVQVVNDVERTTLVSASSINKEVTEQTFKTKIEQAQLVGKLIAERCKEKGITSITFDRNGYLYHGRVKALADSARENGLKF